MRIVSELQTNSHTIFSVCFIHTKHYTYLVTENLG